MKKLLISILMSSVGSVSLFANADPQKSEDWSQSSGFAGAESQSQFSYGHVYDNGHQHKQRLCSKFLSVWWPSHPYACPPVVTWTEISPGLTIGTTQQIFDLVNHVFYSDVVIQNDTGTLIPADSKLIITESNLDVLNYDGFLAESGLPYILTLEDIPEGEALSLRAEFEFKWKKLAYSVDFEVSEFSDGVVAISGVPMVTKLLSANVSDPDGISGEIAYQWMVDGVEVIGANAPTYTPVESDEGAMISVVARYTDDVAFNEEVTSESVGPVAPRPVNLAGSIVINGEKLLGEQLEAVLTDGNGLSTPASYQWFADGLEIEGEISETLFASEQLLGKGLSVAATYTDSDGYDEAVISASSARIVTTVVSGEAELAEAIAVAADGDWLGLASGSYDAMAELSVGDGVSLTLAEGSDAEISGATCIVLNGDRSAIVGLTFNAIDMLVGSTCSTNGESSVYLAGDSAVVSHNSFLGEVAVPSNATYNWLSVKGSHSMIERNAFYGKNMDLKGAAISIFNNVTFGDQFGHVLQYNLFKDFPGGDESSAYAIQIGRSTNSSSNADGGHVVRFNRFDNVKSKQRIIKVQSSRNYIYSNTIEGSIGNVSFENGQENTAANNIILPTGEDADGNDGGIAFAPYGHIVTNNYIAGLRTTSSLRGGLVLNSAEYADSGSDDLEISKVTVANNTIINSRQPINMSSGGCIVGAFVVDFDSNLIANGEDPTVDVDGDYGFEGKTLNGVARDAVIDGCATSGKTTHDNEHYYSADLDKNGTFAFNPEGEGNIFGVEGGADIVAANFGLFEGQGADEGIGADTSKLVYLTGEDVGPESVYIGFQPQFTYNDEIVFGEEELRYWNITFPNGEAESDPQWLIDGNTSDDEFFYGEDGSMTFKCPNIGGTTQNSTYSRTELREMLRGPSSDYNGGSVPKTQGFTANNWVFSTADFTEIQPLMGGVDGKMNATLRVDHVSTTGEAFKIGRVIVGQIHASDDEPLRLYYRKLPGNELGSVYFAHEVPFVGDTLYDLIGTSSQSSPNPIDGIALGEIWSYEIVAVAQNLTVTIRREGKPDVVKTIVMDPAYYQDWMYFKAGVYNQNNSGDEDDYVQATFYSLTKSHGEPVDNSVEIEEPPEAIIDGDTLQASINLAAPGDVLELSDGDYSDMGAITVGVPGITLTRAAGSTAEITGEICLFVPVDGVVITDLVFRDIAYAAGTSCESNGDGAIVITGDGVAFSQNLIDGDALNPVIEGEDTFNWLVLKGSDAVVERNTFQNKQGLTFDSSADLKGSFISIFITGSGENNLVQYNLFKDLLMAGQSTAAAIAVGRTTGASSWAVGNNTVQFNRFDNMDTSRRVMRVQGSENEIRGNTIVNSNGMISLEDGYGNIVSENVILPSGTDGFDGGIAFAQYGHTITDNYVAGSSTTSVEHAPLYVNSDESGSGNSDPANLPSTVTVAGNTIVNANQPILLGGYSCGSEVFGAAFSDNLIVNGVDGVSEAFEGTMFSGVPAVRDDCALSNELSFTNEGYFTGSLSFTGTFTLNGENNIVDAEANALVQAADNGFIEDATGERGADPALLNYIEESDVGVGSTTVF